MDVSLRVFVIEQHGFDLVFGQVMSPDFLAVPTGLSRFVPDDLCI